MDPATEDAVAEVLRRAVLPVVEAVGGAVVDGGTDAGVMRAAGRAREQAGARFPLVGVAAEGTVATSGPLATSGPPATGAAAPDLRHTQLLLVPGADWGDEAPWLAAVADALAVGRPSVTLLVNGGEVAYADARHSVERRRPVLALAGTGRTADVLAPPWPADPPTRRRRSSYDPA